MMIFHLGIAALEGVAAAFAYWGVILAVIAVVDRWKARDAVPPPEPNAEPVVVARRFAPLHRAERLARHRAAQQRTARRFRRTA
jgi:hypothetical protein